MHLREWYTFDCKAKPKLVFRSGLNSSLAISYRLMHVLYTIHQKLPQIHVPHQSMLLKFFPFTV